MIGWSLASLVAASLAVFCVQLHGIAKLLAFSCPV